MRDAAANLDFGTAARLRDEIKRLKMLDLQFANDMLHDGPGPVDQAPVEQARAEYRARYAERPKRGGKK